MQAAPVDFDSLTAGLKTKSDKIRELGRRGVPTKDIARYLDIRYQHARNVLVDAGLHHSAAGASNFPAPTPSAPQARKSVWLTLGADGSLHLPADLLEKCGLVPGGRVYVGQSEDGIELLSRQAALARAQAIARRHIPAGSPSMVDELIAERRREAELENE